MIDLAGKIIGILGLFALALFWSWCLSKTPSGPKQIKPLDATLFLMFAVCVVLGFVGLVKLALA